MTTAFIVGSGPNGLAAAVTLASAGVNVTVVESAETPGGGTRSTEATIPGLLHDECSGFHPLALDNAFSQHFDLSAHGLTWSWAPAEYAHPLDDGRGAVAYRSVADTAAQFGDAAKRYSTIFAPLTARFDKITSEFLQPMAHLPRHPIALAHFGARAALPATWLGEALGSHEAAALWAGVAAHAFHPLSTPLSSAIGVALGTAAHRYGWPVAVGGSASITGAMISLLTSLGGRVETGRTVTSLAELSEADLVLLDTSPRSAARILDGRQPPRIARAYNRFRHGPAAYQVAFAVEGGIPWRYRPARESGTVHVGGELSQVVESERAVWRGQMPSRPFILVGQQYLADPARSVGDVHPIDAYAHVPAGYAGDARDLIISRIEHYAPGFRDRIRAVAVRDTAAIASHNANYVGGDITTGANTARQLLLRPRAAIDPYATGVPGVYLCSAATPPGAGAHGLCGWHAARSALRSANIPFPDSETRHDTGVFR